MKIALAQMNSRSEVEANLASLTRYCREAASAGAVMLFAPEYSLCVTPDPALALNGKDEFIISTLSTIAAECRLWLHAGSVQLAAADASDLRRANASLVFSPDGRLIARYDKVHLFEASLADGESWREADIYAPGDRLVTVATPLGLLGLATCYDVRFPALFDAYSNVPVDAITVPAAFTAQTGHAHWHVLLRARAIETQAFVIAAAQVGQHDDGRQTYGHSMVIDPWGSVLLDMKEDIGIGLCDIDLSQLAHTRRQIPALMNKVQFRGPQKED